MNVIFKTIKTAGEHYVYDRNKNTVIKISEQEYMELCAIEREEASEECSEVIKDYERQGYLKENQLREIKHPCSCFLEHILSNHIEQLTIQVTQRCNLRCQYCTYSGIYEGHNRSHANYDMDFEMAKRAIDFYLDRSMETDYLTFGFYGGEPLLKIDLIRECVKYIKEHAKNKAVHYTITTNGTLLTPEIAEFFFINNFSVLISLDGSKKEHDEYRVFPNGQGSFDTIMSNLKVLHDKFPKEFYQIRFNTVLNPKHDYKHLKLYFEEDELIGNSGVMMTLVDNKSADRVKFGDEFYRATAYERFKLYLYMINKLNVSSVSKLIITDYIYLKRKYENLTNHVEIGCSAHHGGPCIPGGKRLFINVFGEMFPCERVGETSEVMKIGNMDTGFDYTKARNLLNVGKITEKECLGCWALHYCSICCQKADGGNELSKEVKLQYCKNARENASYEIAEVCVLRELGCTFDEKGLSTYENVGLPTYL